MLNQSDCRCVRAARGCHKQRAHCYSDKQIKMRPCQLICQKLSQQRLNSMSDLCLQRESATNLSIYPNMKTCFEEIHWNNRCYSPKELLNFLWFFSLDLTMLFLIELSKGSIGSARSVDSNKRWCLNRVDCSLEIVYLELQSAIWYISK